MKIVEETGKFIALNDDSKIIGELRFSLAGEKLWVIDYTHVNSEFRGQNIGSYLVGYAAEAAREKGIKILPLCSFASHDMQKNLEKYLDVLHQI